MQSKRLLLGALPIYASIVGRRAGVEVEIGGRSARTDGKKIVLPALDVSDQHAAALAYGYLGHEIGHVRYTDFGLDRSGWSKLKRELHNVFEDVFVEREIAKPYPGIAEDIAQLLQKLVADKTLTGPQPGDHPALVLQKYLLYRMRYEQLEQEAFRELARQTEEQFRASVSPGFAAKVGSIIARAAAASSTADTAALAEELMAVLEDEAEPENPAAARGPSDVTPQGRAMSEVAKAILAAGERTLQRDFGSLVAGKLGKAAAQAAQSATGGHGAGVGRADPPPAIVTSGQDLLSRVRAATNALRVRLAALVEASIEEDEDRGPLGLRMDNFYVHRAVLHDPKVFREENEIPDVDTAVVVLFDRSGSMSSRIVLARETALAVTVALEDTPGVAVCCAAFPSEQGDGTGVVPLTAFGESSRATAGRYEVLQASGGTPMTEAIWWAALELAARTEARKILLVVTDGDPDCRTSCSQAIEILQASGVEALGLGINAQSVTSLFPVASVIHSMGELAPAVFRMLQHKLVRQAA